MSADLIFNKKRGPTLAQAPIHPELVHTTPETLLLATLNLLREHLPEKVAG
jgi:hypothetical protein